MAQTVFERVEKKYFVTEAQAARIAARLTPDVYGSYTIRNLYYDTADFALIRHSIEKPIYKEKLRLRSYGGEDVFIELKKKYDGVVYKRRARADFLDPLSPQTQIEREIGYFLSTHAVTPRVFLGYEREAYADGALRVTFDRNLRYRASDLTLTRADGAPLLTDARVLMEVKIPGAMPLWLSHLLAEERIYPTSFSKYGTYFKEVACCA